MSHETFFREIATRLLVTPEPEALTCLLEPDWMPPVPFEQPPVPAAVLIALIEREGGTNVLYTERSKDLRSHSGQISFPGGKIDAKDRDAADAALREAEEEIGLDRADAKILGYLPAYLTGTNYLITPVVARVKPRRPFVANPREVRDIFEVPLNQLMEPQNFGSYLVERAGKSHTTWRILHKDKLIWGITGNLTRCFHDIALAGVLVS